MAKRLLGLPEKTTNEAVLGELGWIPMKSIKDMIRIKYWRKTIKMKKNRLTKIIYEWERKLEEQDSWITYTKNIIRIGFGRILGNSNNK